MKTLQEILKIVNRSRKRKILLKDFKSFELYSKEPKNFEGFLIESRVWIFMRLLIIFRFFDLKFIVGNETYRIYDVIDEEGDEEVPDLGPCIVKERFKGKQLFNYLLGKLEIAQLSIKDCHNPYR